MTQYGVYLSYICVLLFLISTYTQWHMALSSQKAGDNKAAASYERHALATGLKDIERIAISHIRSLQSLLKWLWLGTQLNVPLDLGDV